MLSAVFKKIFYDDFFTVFRWSDNYAILNVLKVFLFFASNI